MKQLLAIIALAFLFSCNSHSSVNPSLTDTTISDSSQFPAETIITTPTNKLPENWNYNEDEDKMDGKVSYFAACDSYTPLYFSAPYDGGSIMRLTIRKQDGKNELIVSITKGQFMGSYDGSATMRFKFDDQKPIVVGFNEPADNSSTYIFPEQSAILIKKLKESSSVMVEAPFFQEGKKQAEFITTGLKWSH